MLPEKFYGMMNVECPCFDKGNLIKHKKGDMVLLEQQLLNTLEHKFDKLQLLQHLLLST